MFWPAKCRCAGLPNAAAVFVFGVLRGLGLLRAWESNWVSRGGRNEAIPSTQSTGTNGRVIAAAA